MTEKATRWSGADWATEQKEIFLVGVGGIGSWATIALARLGHTIYPIDGDVVDESNVEGGQAFGRQHLGATKVGAIQQVCREFGCGNEIWITPEMYDGEEHGATAIMICGLDNMKARMDVFDRWKKEFKDDKDAVFIDGRLTLEMMEVFTIQGGNKEQIEEYENEHLFSDAEADLVDCTAKQTTFSAMMIGGLIASTLTNFLTNRKLGEELREVPFYQRLVLPLMQQTFKHTGKEVEVL